MARQEGKPTAKGQQMRVRILRVAERLFAEHGYDGVSMRRIAAAADTKIAHIAYYFGGKADLYRAVFEHRIAPISEARRSTLQLLLARASPPPTVIEVLEAFARPWFETQKTASGRHYTRLIAREVNDPREEKRGIVRDLLDPVAVDFVGALETVLPERDRAEIHLFYHIFVGAILLLMAAPKRPKRISGGIIDFDRREESLSDTIQLIVRCLDTPTSVAPPSAGAASDKDATTHALRHFPAAPQRSSAKRSAPRRGHSGC